MNYIKVPSKQLKSVIKATFPDYRKRTVIVKATTKVTFSDLNWSGGTRAEYKACTVHGEEVPIKYNMSAPAPWNNPFEGQTVDLPVDCVVVEGGYFCGKKRTLYIYIHPQNMPASIEYKA